eukprot:12535075-Alexandrium_andersonii.AAC.1
MTAPRHWGGTNSCGSRATTRGASRGRTSGGRRVVALSNAATKRRRKTADHSPGPEIEARPRAFRLALKTEWKHALPSMPSAGQTTRADGRSLGDGSR